MDCKTIFPMAVFLLVVFTFCVAAADEPVVPQIEQEFTEPTVVVINSNRWQDAYLASIYANLNKLRFRFIQDPYQSKDFFDELSSNKFNKVIVFSRKDSPVLSLTYLLRSQNLEIHETTFEDHYDLSVKMLEQIPSNEVIIVRDDFAFDALSVKYLSVKLNAPVIFSRGPEDMDPKVMDALNKMLPKKIYLVGRPSPNLEKMLANYPLVKLQGRDEFDTNNIVNDYAVQNEIYQSVVTTGDIYELSIMNIRGQPVFLVPDAGTYSLTKTAEIITRAKMQILLGIGQLVSTPGTWLRERTGAKLLVKFGSVRTGTGDAGFVKHDINIRLEGYELPLPMYNGSIVDIDPAYTDPLGPATASFVNQENKVAPPVEFRIYAENTGNIDFPSYVTLDIRDEKGQLITTLTSEKMEIYPKKSNVFKVRWGAAPAEGKYTVEAKLFGDVYEGLSLPGKNKDFELRWLFVLFNLLLILIALIMLILAVYSSHVLSGDIRRFGGVFKLAGEQMDKLAKYVTEIYHFRGGKKGKK